MPASKTRKPAVKSRPEAKGRPTLYKGIQMRSRLEADFAAFLDRTGATWEYEPQCYASERGQWLPDFRVQERGQSQEILVEVKPAELLRRRAGEGEDAVVERIDKILTQTEVVWDSEHDALVNVIFWTWGAPSADMLIIGGPGAEYHVRISGFPFFFLWPGMNQAHTIDIFARAARDIRAGREIGGPGSELRS